MLDALLPALFPLVCPGCGRRGDPLCARCTAQLRPAPPAPPPAGIDAWAAAFAYVGVGREVVARVKYRGARAAVPWLADAMVDAVLDLTGSVPPTVPWAAAPEAVSWAPTTRERRRHRGFDPAELLARAVARRLGARAFGMLEREPGPPQTGRSAADRRLGPRYSPRRVVPPAVLLVDDVATTGATLAAASSALRASGARVVVAVTAARTPPPRRS